MFLWLNNSNTSCLFVFTLLMTGIRKNNEKKREQEAAINRYKKILISVSLVSLECLIMASVELFKDIKTLFKQFYLFMYFLITINIT